MAGEKDDGLSDGGWQKAIRPLDSQMKHRTDEALADLRPMYEDLDPNQRGKVKAWLSAVVALETGTPAIPQLDCSLRVEISQPNGDGYSVVKLKTATMLRAMESWDRGEHYTPTTIGELS